ncbi:hypothetical protein HY572_00295 [Candidatus Micrarchaeota archaeon]|nr:hypothetical protein [Candidatus Micrarchaeota archaeon]
MDDYKYTKHEYSVTHMEHPYGPLLEHFGNGKAQFKVQRHARGPLLVFTARTPEEKSALWNEVKRVRAKLRQTEQEAPKPQARPAGLFQRVFGIGRQKETPQAPAVQKHEEPKLREKPKNPDEQLRQELEALARDVFPSATHYADVTKGVLAPGTFTLEVARRFNGP